MVAQHPDSEMLRHVLQEQWNNAGGTAGIPDAQAKLEDLLKTTRTDTGGTDAAGDEITGLSRFWKGSRWRFAAAAAILFLAGGAYLLFGPKDQEPDILVKERPQDVAPGGERATLTLADGTAILLDSTGSGVLAQQSGMQIVKLDSGQLAYQAGDQGGTEKEQYNTLTTPRGGQYRVTLPDGTRVWLNAASSLRYPAAFTGGERNVELNGEAYFEVASREKMPFIVQLNGMEVEVLGTHFNIMAYEDENTIQTTLLEGSVAVSTKSPQAGNKKQETKNSKRLKPGQQARLSKGTADLEIAEVNTNEAVAWKDGFFQFERASLPVVMRQLERWYNIEVVYEGAIPEQYFGGRIPRNLPLSKIISVLEHNKVRFRIEGRRLIILKQEPGGGIRRFEPETTRTGDGERSPVPEGH